jgi:hypothetical protein
MKPKTFILVGMVCTFVGLLSCRSMNEDAQSARYPLLTRLPGAAIIMDNPKELLAIIEAQDPSEKENPHDIPPWERLA